MSTLKPRVQHPEYFLQASLLSMNPEHLLGVALQKEENRLGAQPVCFRRSEEADIWVQI